MKKKTKKKNSKKRINKNTNRSINKNFDSSNKVESSMSKTYILSILSFCMCLILILSNYSLCGKIGEIIKSINIFIFGTFGYITPFLIFVLINFNLYFNKSKKKTFYFCFLYLIIVSIFFTFINNDYYNKDLFKLLLNNFDYAKNTFSLEANKFAGGILSTTICYFLYMSLGKIAMLIIFFTLLFITIIFIFGVKTVYFIKEILIKIFMIIPNMIKKVLSVNEENKKIEIDNENLLNSIIDKTKYGIPFDEESINENKSNIEEDFDELGDDVDFNYLDNNLKQDTIEKNNNLSIKNINIFNNNKVDDEQKDEISKRNIKISSKDIESKLFKINDNEINVSINKKNIVDNIPNENYEKNDPSVIEEIENKKDTLKEFLLEEMKNKSINEILYKNQKLKPSEFFYEDKFHNIEESNLENKNINVNNFVNIDEMTNDEKVDDVKIDISYENEYGSEVPFDENIIDDNENNDLNNDDYVNNNNDDLKNTKEFNIDNINDILSKDTNMDLNIPNTIDEYTLNDNTIEKTLDKFDNVELSNNENVLDEENTINTNYVNDTVKKDIKIHKKYKFPPLSFLNRSESNVHIDMEYVKETQVKLKKTLEQFGVMVNVTNVTVGPSVTRYEIQPSFGVKVSQILNRQDDIKLTLAASDIRIEAPIPGKSAIGIEVQNKDKTSVLLGDIISSKEFRDSNSKLTVAIGKDISGKIITCDLRKMPHLLVAGATGSGKSVCINSLIMSLIYKASPSDVKLILVDPKVVELQCYNSIPHLHIPVVSDPKKASNALSYAVKEMMRRYNLIVEKKVRDIESYNNIILEENKNIINEEDKIEKIPYLVIIIDEFADLMMVASKDVENSIFRIAQLARACGIYLVIATQRPSVNVISGSIKANVPSRISFAVSSGIDSKTILDRVGAEKLIGAGDMLYFPTGIPEPIRVQGCYVSSEEIQKVVDYVKDDVTDFDEEFVNGIELNTVSNNTNKNNDEKDEYFFEAGKLAITQQKISIGLLQRKFAIGFNRAARIIDSLEEEGVISGTDGKKSREALMQLDEFIMRYKK